MKNGKTLIGTLVLAIVISACGGSPPAREEAQVTVAPTAEAMATEEMMADDASDSGEVMSDDAAMGEDVTHQEMAEQDQEMAESGVSDNEGMMDDASSPGEGEDEGMMEDASTGDDAVMRPAWYGVELTDVNSGTSFQVADFKGKVVLVETMAVWCSTCLRQQKQVLALHELLGERDDLVSLALDIDPNETPDILKTHAEKNGFDWVYAVAPVEVAREIGQLYGNQFLNPPSAPMLIIDRQGQAHPLPFGVKDAQSLQDALAPHLNGS